MTEPLPTCPVCRKAVELGDGTLLRLGERDLAVVHREPCAQVIRSGVTTVGKMLLTGAEIALAKRAPRMHTALQAFRGFMHKLGEQAAAPAPMAGKDET